MVGRLMRAVGAFAFVALAFVSGPAVASRAALAAGGDEALHLTINESPRSLQPLLAGTTDEQTLASLAFDTLLKTQPDATLAPDLATEVPSLRNGGISRDGRRVVFHLRPGVKWQDGRPFSSADVAFTFKAILDPNNPIVDRTGYSDIASVETPNPLTVVVHLKRTYSPFVAIVGNQFPIVPAHLLASSKNLAEDPFNANPIGTGPYRFVRQFRGDRIEYAANPTYWGGAPKIARIAVAEIPSSTTQAIELRQGTLDYAATESSEFAQLRQDRSLVSAITPINDFVAEAFNVTRPILADRDVRRAIAMAIDRAALVRDDTFGTGTVAYADLPDFMWTHREPHDPYGYDPKAARALLDRAGWHVGPDGVRVKNGVRLHLVDIDFAGSVTGRNLDTQIQQMLADVGVEVELKYYSISLYYSPAAQGGPISKGDFDIAAYIFSASSDPLDDEIFGCASRAPNGFNAARYCSPEMEKLQSASLAELDPEKRLVDVAKIEALAVSDMPYVFLYHTPLRVIRTPRLANSRATFGAPLYKIQDWSFAR